MFWFLLKLIKSNNGYSSKTLTMLWAMTISTLLFLTIVILVIVDLFTDYSVDTDLYGISAVIGGITMFVISAIAGKVYGDRSYINNTKNNSELNNINKLEDE